MRIEKKVSLPQGNDYFIRYNEKSEAIAYYVVSGKVLRARTKLPEDNSEPVWVRDEDFNLMAKDVLGIQGTFIGEIGIILVFCKDYVLIIKDPDDTGQYDYRDPYRYYYNVEDHLLYQNIGSSWIPVATKDHAALDGRGRYTHEEIDSFIDLAGGGTGPSVEDLLKDIELMKKQIATLTQAINDTMSEEVL